MQRRKRLLAIAESQIGSSYGAKDSTLVFIEKVLEKVEDLEAY